MEITLCGQLCYKDDSKNDMILIFRRKYEKDLLYGSRRAVCYGNERMLR